MHTKQRHGNHRWIPPDLGVKPQHYKKQFWQSSISTRKLNAWLKVNMQQQNSALLFQAQMHLSNIGCIPDTSSNFAKSWHHASCSWSGLLLWAGVPGETTLLTNILHSAAEYCTPALPHTRLTYPVINDVLQLWLHPCVLHQRTIFLSLRASNLLSFITKGPHCLQHAVLWGSGHLLCSKLTYPPCGKAWHLKSRHPLVPIARQLISSSDSNRSVALVRSPTECGMVGQHYETLYFLPWYWYSLSWNCLGKNSRDPA